MTARRKFIAEGGGARPVRAGAGNKSRRESLLSRRLLLRLDFDAAGVKIPRPPPLFFIFYAPGGHGRGSLIACCF